MKNHSRRDRARKKRAQIRKDIARESDNVWRGSAEYIEQYQQQRAKVNEPH